jgi:peptide/nickel transport system substrate-binding protein
MSLLLDRRQVMRLAGLLGLGAAAGCAPGPAADRGKTLRFASEIIDMGNIHSNPWPNSATLVNPVLDYLCVVDAQGVTRGALAERWTVSPDLRSWTFHLRQGVRWRKGRPLTADDVLWNWRRWVDPAIGSAYMGGVMSYMMNVAPARKGPDGDIPARWTPWDANLFEKVDDHTIRLNLKAPAVTVAEDLFTASSLICDPEEGGIFQVGCNGTGPFELAEYGVNDKAVYLAHDRSWRGRPGLDRLELVDVGHDFAAVSAALVSNQIQGVTNLEVENARIFDKNPDIRLYAAPSANTFLARMHCDIKPFDDPRVRKALRLAIDAPRAVSLVQGQVGSPAQHHHVSPSQPDCAPAAPPRRDLAEARRLLAEAGHPNGFTTTLNATTRYPIAIKTAQVLAEMWSQIGVRANIEPVTQEDYLVHWADYPLSITQWTHRPLAIMTLALSYRTGAPWNESRYSNPEVDALIDKAQLVLSSTQRREQIGRIQHLLQEDGPLIQPIWTPSIAAFRRTVGGAIPHPMGYYPAETFRTAS